MDLKKIRIIMEWNTRRSVKDVQYFLGFANFYQIFNKDYSKIATPLTYLIENQKFTWIEKAEKTFQGLK